MIGRGNSIKHAGNALAYAGEKLHAVEIDRQYVQGATPQAIEREFQLFQDFNTRCQKNTLAFVLSPTIEDGRKLNSEALRGLVREFVKGMGLEEHQFVAYAHRDKAHQHVHLYVNRISLEGKAYDDCFPVQPIQPPGRRDRPGPGIENRPPGARGKEGREETPAGTRFDGP